MINLVIFGAPGSGKGTQSERISRKYGLHHISTGDVLRKHIANGTDLGKVADSFISKGQLIPDDLMIKVLENELESPEAKAGNGVIFDGFPRTIPQASALNDLLRRRGSDIHAVVGLEVPEEELVDRMLKRGLVSGRSDDNPETIKNRLAVYHAQTSPLKDFYIKQGKYRNINGSGDMESIFNDISKEIDTLSTPGL